MSKILQDQYRDHDQNIEEIRIDIPDEEEKVCPEYLFGQPTWNNYVLLPQTPPKDDNRMEEEIMEITDLETEQTFNAIEMRKPREHFVNHLADISTTNGSDAEEKFEQEYKASTENKLFTNEKTDVHIDSKHAESAENLMQNSDNIGITNLNGTGKNPSKVTNEKTLTKTTDAVVDNWSLFEEFDKKISKSQKKKQKKRSKKQAEQELLKAEEEEAQKNKLEENILVLEGDNINKCVEQILQEKPKIENDKYETKKQSKAQKKGANKNPNNKEEQKINPSKVDVDVGSRKISSDALSPSKCEKNSSRRIFCEARA